MKFSRSIRKSLGRKRDAAVLELYRWRGKQIVHFLHIGKTGGTALKDALSQHTRGPNYVLALQKHELTLRDVPTGDKTFFFLRDPISRYASGFISRQRQGLPRHFTRWNPGEECAFERFRTANELALSLSAEDEETRLAAERAMMSIVHVRTSFWDWFIDREFFLSRLSEIVFIGFQERLNEDFERLRDVLHLPRSLRLPGDDVEAHRNPRNSDTRLEAAARKNLLTWYRRDYEFLELCNDVVTLPEEMMRAIDDCLRLHHPMVHTQPNLRNLAPGFGKDHVHHSGPASQRAGGSC